MSGFGGESGNVERFAGLARAYDPRLGAGELWMISTWNISDGIARPNAVA